MKILILFIILYSFTFCHAQQPKQNLSDSVYNEMIWFAKGEVVINDTIFKIDSNSSYYVVATITNKLTNETKDICTLYEKLQYAITIDSSVCQKKCNRKFSLSSKKSLEIIGFDDYKYEKFTKCTKELNADSLYQKALNHPIEFANKYSGECQQYIAHLLFNHGVMSSPSSLSGHIYVLGKADKKELINSMLKTNK